MARQAVRSVRKMDVFRADGWRVCRHLVPLAIRQGNDSMNGMPTQEAYKFLIYVQIYIFVILLFGVAAIVWLTW